MRHAISFTLLTCMMLLFAACGNDASSQGDPCAGVLCSGYGDCVVDAGAARCACQANYVAVELECRPALCKESTCIHGQCLEPAKSATCACFEGYTGPTCADCAAGYSRRDLLCVKTDGCAIDPCAHGECKAQGDTAFTCDCYPGYTGPLCDACKEGYEKDGELCVAETPCSPNPCGHGSCSEVGGEARCACQEGYDGTLCDTCAKGYERVGLSCVAASPGDPCTPNPCKEENRTRCVVDSGAAKCLCSAGFEETNGSCTAQSVCEAASTCSGHGTCTGTGLNCACEAAYGGAHCEQCAEGYEFKGQDCVPKGGDPCAANPCNEPHRGVCTVGAGQRALCGCDEGYAESGGLCLVACRGPLCADAHTSFSNLVSANGHGALVLDLNQKKLTRLMEHSYLSWGPNEQGKIANTRNLLYDSFLGLRVNGSGTWLSALAIDAADYYGESGIMRIVQHVGELRIETFAYAPWELARPALVLIGRVTNLGTTEADVALYSLHNYHLGKTKDDADTAPDATGERITARDTQTYAETGPGGVLIHRALDPITHKGAAASTAADTPYALLQSAQDLQDQTDTQAGDDRVAGFQKSFTLAAGATGSFGVVSAYGYAGEDTTISQELDLAYKNGSAATLKEALANWEAWRKPAPAGLDAAESAVWRSSEAILRMGQVWQTNSGSYSPQGQILASLPPGIWAISWARDMSYSIVGLARSGHFKEARAALSFMMKARANTYKSYLNNLDYQISVCRYYGQGLEESDSNGDGPNVEFDGFGLFLWALREYVAASNDATLLDEAGYAVVRDKIANALVALTNSTNDLIAADSSIWEVHWNGKQKQYIYTSASAAKGLCEASLLAAALGKSADAASWQTQAQKLAKGLKDHAVSGNFLVQSIEEVSGANVDAAVVEAFNWGLFDPKGAVADTTLARFDTALKVASGHGYFRNDDGGEYDSQEWLFIDLRLAYARLLRGEADKAALLIDWTTAQATKNYGLIPELLDKTSADYTGAIPMVGFGAASYMMDLLAKQTPSPIGQGPCGVQW